MVCLDRDRGAISCCSGGARLPRGWDGGFRGGENGRAAGSPVLAPELGFVAADGSRDAACPGPQCRSRRKLWMLVSPSTEPGAAAGTGVTKRAARPSRCWIGLVKSFKNNIYMCGFFGQGSESLLIFQPLRSPGITQHTVKDDICAELCVCV